MTTYQPTTSSILPIEESGKKKVWNQKDIRWDKEYVQSISEAKSIGAYFFTSDVK